MNSSNTPKQTATKNPNLENDRRTLYAMGSIYCTAHHASAVRDEHGLCERCREIIDYSQSHAADCPFGHQGNCNDCEVHCYKPGMREGILEIMRYGAPRMTYRHPILTARYLKKKLAGKSGS